MRGKDGRPEYAANDQVLEALPRHKAASRALRDAAAEAMGARPRIAQKLDSRPPLGRGGLSENGDVASYEGAELERHKPRREPKADPLGEKATERSGAEAGLQDACDVGRGEGATRATRSDDSSSAGENIARVDDVGSQGATVPARRLKGETRD